MADEDAETLAERRPDSGTKPPVASPAWYADQLNTAEARAERAEAVVRAAQQSHGHGHEPNFPCDICRALNAWEAAQ